MEELFRRLVGLGLLNHSLTRKEGSIISQLQNVGEQQRLQNRKAIKALIRCTHFLAHQHIARATNLTNELNW